MMTTTIRKTVDIPADRRLYLELPQDTPTGSAEITLTISGAASERQAVEMMAAEYERDPELTAFCALDGEDFYEAR